MLFISFIHFVGPKRKFRTIAQASSKHEHNISGVNTELNQERLFHGYVDKK